jgi:hypothetical protein
MGHSLGLFADGALGWACLDPDIQRYTSGPSEAAPYLTACLNPSTTEVRGERHKHLRPGAVFLRACLPVGVRGGARCCGRGDARWRASSHSQCFSEKETPDNHPGGREMVRSEVPRPMEDGSEKTAKENLVGELVGGQV